MGLVELAANYNKRMEKRAPAPAPVRGERDPRPPAGPSPGRRSREQSHSPPAFFLAESFRYPHRPAPRHLNFKKSSGEILASADGDSHPGLDPDNTTAAVRNFPLVETAQPRRASSSSSSSDTEEKLSRAFNVGFSINSVPKEQPSQFASHQLSMAYSPPPLLGPKTLPLQIFEAKNPEISSALSTQDSRKMDCYGRVGLEERGFSSGFGFEMKGFAGRKEGAFDPFRGKYNAEKKSKPKRKSCKVSEEEYKINLDRVHEVGKTALNIKNIPNKYTKEMMLELIDKEFKGCYDFFYLPIDLDQKCNQGFAFIKLTDVKFVRPFVMRFDKTKWPKFNSEKICEIRYARLQRTEDLKNHFKNSSLMKQPETKYKPYIRNSEDDKIKSKV